jgi:hypothetical protein
LAEPSADAVQEATQADDASGQLPSLAEEDVSPLKKGPPQATPVRRAQSYSRLHADAEQHVHTTPSAVLPRKNSLSSAHKPKDLLQTTLDFATWYDALEDDLLDDSHHDYELYYNQLNLSQHHLDSLIESTNDALTVLSSLSDSFNAVDDQTTAFHAQCESL